MIDCVGEESPWLGSAFGLAVSHLSLTANRVGLPHYQEHDCCKDEGNK